MAQPPKKPPVLPGLGGQPQAPTRPLLPGLPMQPAAATPASSTIKTQALLDKFTARITKAGKFAVVLEVHTSSVLQALSTNTQVAAALKQSGFAGIYSEVDARMLRASSVNAVFPKTIRRLSAPPKAGAPRDASAALFNAFVQTAQNVFRTATPIPVHAVGDEFIAADEALKIVRARLNRDPLLIEQIFLSGVKAQRDQEAKRNPASPAVTLLDQILAPNQPFPAALMDLINLATYMPVDDKADTQKFISSLAREMATPTNQKHIEELTAVFEEVIRLRTQSAGDEHMARNALAHAQGNNILFIVGAGHGLSNSAASLPSQLAAQAGVSDADVQVILPMQKMHEKLFYGEMLALQSKGELRDDIIIFDMQNGDEMKADAWMVKMSQSLTPPAAPTGNAPQP